MCLVQKDCKNPDTKHAKLRISNLRLLYHAPVFFVNLFCFFAPFFAPQRRANKNFAENYCKKAKNVV